jgi:hypothetical protein
MDFFIDKQEPALYVTTKRNGSTLMAEISSVSTHLQRIEIAELAEVLSKEKHIPIYSPIRDPLTRFKSGLSVNLFNRSDFKFNKVTDTSLELFKHMLIYFDDCIGESGKLLSTYPVRPFHLYDPHCDHWLGSLMLFGALGFNLQVVPMNKFSQHLESRFPQGVEFIKNRERPDSFNNTKEDYEKLWEIYKEVFIERVPDHIQCMKENNEKIITFNEWMNPEIDIFNMLMQNKETAMHQLSNHYLDLFLDKKIYFNDLYSPNIQDMSIVLEELAEHKLLTRRLYKILALYRDVKNYTYKVHSLDITPD